MAGQTALERLDKTLSDQERIFVMRIVSGMNFSEAYRETGYDVGVANWQQRAATLARKPAVLAAIHHGIARQLVHDAARARSVAAQLMDDESVSAAVRAKLALALLQTAGFVAPKSEAADRSSEKSLSELSLDQLRERAEAMRREIADRGLVDAKSSHTLPSPLD